MYLHVECVININIVTKSLISTEEYNVRFNIPDSFINYIYMKFDIFQIYMNLSIFFYYKCNNQMRYFYYYEHDPKVIN